MIHTLYSIIEYMSILATAFARRIRDLNSRRRELAELLPSRYGCAHRHLSLAATFATTSILSTPQDRFPLHRLIQVIRLNPALPWP
jgi:hypothetical protein